MNNKLYDDRDTYTLLDNRITTFLNSPFVKILRYPIEINMHNILYNDVQEETPFLINLGYELLNDLK